MDTYAHSLVGMVLVLLMTSAAPADLIAYNDFGGAGSGFAGGNVTTYTLSSGGVLKDYVTGSATGITMSLSCGSSAWVNATQGGLTAGTDAYQVFHGIVDTMGLTSSNSSGSGYGPYTITFTGLNPGGVYEIVLYGDRGWDGGGLTAATSNVYAISDVDSFENHSSTGVSGATATMNVGYNTPTGYVAHYTNIQSGSDGDFQITVSATGGDDAWRLNGMSLTPEPATIALLGLGGLGLAMVRRRRAA